MSKSDAKMALAYLALILACLSESVLLVVLWGAVAMANIILSLVAMRSEP